jgi:catechol-2,3-dioxygenase
MKINKVVARCIYSSGLDGMKRFYAGILGLPVVQEEKGKFVSLKAGRSMLLVFNPARTSVDNDSLPAHGAASPPASLHFAMEIEEHGYERWNDLLAKSRIAVEKEVSWKGRGRSLHFRDPAGNLVELITPGECPVES